MDKVCKNHPEKKAISYCHNCGVYYCSECLNEGKEYYYCDNKDCFEKYEEEIQSIAPKKIKIYLINRKLWL